jgi:tetratricopeptide (TPR) repeat protein
VADAMFNLAWTTDWTAQPVEARRYFDRVSDAYGAIGDERGLARTLYLHGQLLLKTGQAEAAIEVLRSAIERYRALDDVSYLSMTTGALGSAYLMLGDRDEAIHWFIDGVFTVARELADEVAMTLVLPVGALAAIERGKPAVAVMIMGAHETLSRTYGIRPPVALRLVFEEFRALDRARALLEVADFEEALQRGRSMTLEDVVELIGSLEDEAPQRRDA